MYILILCGAERLSAFPVGWQSSVTLDENTHAIKKDKLTQQQGATTNYNH